MTVLTIWVINDKKYGSTITQDAALAMDTAKLPEVYTYATNSGILITLLTNTKNDKQLTKLVKVSNCCFISNSLYKEIKVSNRDISIRFKVIVYTWDNLEYKETN